MNVKPGDLARIVHPDAYGRMCEVLSVAPIGQGFRLPNGVWQLPCSPGVWVIRMLGSPIAVLRVSGPNVAMYAACEDRWLRPIRDPGEDAQDEMLRPLPHEVTA